MTELEEVFIMLASYVKELEELEYNNRDDIMKVLDLLRVARTEMEKAVRAMYKAGEIGIFHLDQFPSDNIQIMLHTAQRLLFMASSSTECIRDIVKSMSSPIQLPYQRGWIFDDEGNIHDATEEDMKKLEDSFDEEGY